MSRIKTGNLLCLAALSLAGFTTLLPLLWMLSTSLKTPTEVFAYPPKWLPESPVWSNYRDAWNTIPFGRYYINSILVSACITAGQLVTCSMAGYAFARLRFPGRDFLFFGYLATMMVPGAVTLIPAFLIVRALGMIDSLWGVIIPGIFSAYGTFMLRQFFMGIPRELEEAATIDGCGFFSIFWRIFLPLSKAPLATLATFSFLGSWSGFLWPLLILYSPEKRTLPIGILAFNTYGGTEWHLMMAAMVIVLLPPIALYIFNQRYFVESMKLSGMGGT